MAELVHVIKIDASAAIEVIEKYSAYVAQIIKQRDELLSALTELLARDERNTCQHENTHRGGAIWEICDDCGAKWADDHGGKPAWVDPIEWDLASAAIAKTTGETK